MRGRAVRHQFDECRSAAVAGSFGGPLRDRVHGQVVVAVDADSGHAVTGTARREGVVLTAGKALESGDRPLIIDDVENHRRPVDGGERHRLMKVRLGARALACPGRRDPILTLDRSGHRPTHGLWKLGGEIARDRKDVARARVIHDGHLAPFAHVAGVGQALAHQIDEIAPSHDLHALIAIGRKQHVARQQGHCRGNGDGLLAGRLHVERSLPLALHALHAVVEDPREQHVPQTDLQVFRLQMRVPGAGRTMPLIKHPHHLDREPLHLVHGRGDLRSGHGAGR